MVKLKLTLVLIFASLTIGCSSSPPSDKSMEEKFRAHEADFRKLVSMFKEDANLNSVDETSAYLQSNQPNSRPKAEIPAERVDEYRRLLQVTGVKNVFRGKDSIHFVTWRGWGWDVDPGNTKGKDYVYAEKPPSPLVDSLEQTENLPNNQLRNGVYKKIADNWYLEYSIID